MDQPTYLVVDDEQAAALFRLHVQRPLCGCQFERTQMRWWLAQGLVLTLAKGEWRLSMVPTHGGTIDEEAAGEYD